MPATSPEQIHALITAAFNSADLDAFIDLHEPDALSVVPPEGRVATGHAEIRAALAHGEMPAELPQAVAGYIRANGLYAT